MAGNLLLISEREDDEEFAREVGEVAELDVTVVASPKAAVEQIKSGPSAIFVDGTTVEQYQEFENTVRDSIGLFSDLISANAIHFISSEDLHNVGHLFESPIFGHFVSRNYGNARAAGQRYGYIVKVTKMDRAFDLKNLLPKKAKIQIVKFANTTQKQDGVEAVKNFLIALKFKSRMATVIANAVDELIMNAMYDAPVDELGNHIYLKTPRDTPIDLADKSAVEMHVGYDGSYVAITAIDHFGSLDRKKLFNHISQRYVDEEYKIKKSYAGAGIGLATVFRSGGSFFFSSETGEKTEVTVFFKRTDNFREFKDQFRFISTQFYL